MEGNTEISINVPQVDESLLIYTTAQFVTSLVP